MNQNDIYYIRSGKRGITSTGRFLEEREETILDENGKERVIFNRYFIDIRSGKTIINPVFWQNHEQYISLRRDGKIKLVFEEKENKKE